MIKAVIFDVDGVLIDTVQMGLRARKELLLTMALILMKCLIRRVKVTVLPH